MVSGRNVNDRWVKQSVKKSYPHLLRFAMDRIKMPLKLDAIFNHDEDYCRISYLSSLTNEINIARHLLLYQ